jgi:hypothetical protein
VTKLEHGSDKELTALKWKDANGHEGHAGAAYIQYISSILTSTEQMLLAGY